ncbi:phage holin family protein [Archangium lansingense]|uniref:Phage holin family protein n=1 Tax=Archangium lansingense TaxID=2995310 RepID=A0ABT4A6X4_9BACT|nr:phage holin family protein [Archangium lansinium]MCY1076734.1 phage holin family protein [Archangium lansinium]
MGLGTEQTERGLTVLVGRLTDGFSKLVTQHLTLARVELMEDARVMGSDVARIAAFVPFVLVGYAFLCAALSAFLARWIGWDGSLALVGAVNLVVGGLGIARAANRLKSFQVMDETTRELNRSVSVLAQAPVPAVQPATLPREAGHGR